jgi:hypothetical protein
MGNLLSSTQCCKSKFNHVKDIGLRLCWTLFLTKCNSLLASNSASWNGGAISALEDSTLDIEYSIFTNNQAVIGGALYNLGTADIIQSTFVDNIASAAVSGQDDWLVDLCLALFARVNLTLNCHIQTGRGRCCRSWIKHYYRHNIPF